MQPPKPNRRPSTQVPPPRAAAGGKVPTSRQPAVRPVTQIHKSPTTRMPQEPAPRLTTRSPRAVAAKKSSLPLILGVAGGALVLIIVIAVAASGGSAPAKAAPKKAAPAGVDVSSLENDGMKKCEEGLVLIQRSYDKSDKAGLQRGVALITEGNSLLDKANQLSGHTYDTKRFNEAFKMARNKILELK